MTYTLDAVAEKLEENLAALSPTAAKVIELAGDINSSPAALTRAIRLDPVLSARVLRLVNSSYFGLGREVTGLEKAVIMVGLNTIRNLALSAAVLSRMLAPPPPGRLDADAFWTHSLGVGVAAKRLALRRGVGVLDAEDFFLAGMIHDLGLLVEDLLYPEETERFLLTSRSFGLLTMEEAEMGGMNHCRVGEALGRRWGLPPGLLAVLAFHHDPPGDCAEPDLVRTVYLANAFCKNRGVGLVLDDTPVAVREDVRARLGADAAAEEAVLDGIYDDIRKAREFLQP